MASKFVHLHCHSEYSLLDGLPKTKDLIRHVKELGMDAVALTDHGAMHGIIEFYKNAKKEGVKPIIGMEAYTTNISLAEKPEKGKVKNYHLLLLAKNNQGYKNLMKLTSIAHLKGYYYRPRIDRETLKKYSKGLICTSACAQGEIASALVGEGYEAAKKIANWFTDVFGGDYYLELQRHNYGQFINNVEISEAREEVSRMAEKEKILDKGIIKLSRDLGIPIVATNDTHYLKKEDAAAQDTLVCVATGKEVSDIKRLRFIDTPDFYVKSPSEMIEKFSDVPDAIKNTVKIAEKCSVEITLNKWFFPKYKLPKGKTANETLTDLANKGLKQRFKKISKTLQKRLDYELSIITEKGYSPYFLINSDMALWAKKQGIVTNTRGSAAGSLVSYTIGIIDINPLLYELPFERFLTPWRPSPPDIDFDIADDRREEVIGYLEKTYGSDRTAQICTFGRMLSRASVRDVARVLGFPYATGDKIAKLIPPPRQGFPITIDKALKESKELKTLYDTDTDAKKVLDLARQLEGNARHVSVHAAGVVIAPDKIINYTPVQKDPKGTKIITQYDMEALDPNVSAQAVGLLKFDLLGLRNLSILGAAVDFVKQTRNTKVDIHALPLNDKMTFAMLSRGETMGVFQLSGSGMTRYLKELKPERLEDIMAMLALYRPGPIAQIPEYIERKNDPNKIAFFDPRMKEYLGKSYGLIVYQDDVFMTAIKIAGYTWEEADKFRKAVGKKIPEEMESQKEKFLKGAVDGGMVRAEAEELFKLIEPFSGYGFNKAHAASYGMVAYQTAFMKANFPVEFMAALLTAESGNSEKVSTAVAECRRMKIKVLPPDINKSNVGFKIISDPNSLEGRAIRFGLNAIKNVGTAAIEAILAARQEGEFVSFADFLSKVDQRKVNKKVLESLIKVGALSEFGNRASLLSSIDEIRSRVAKPKVGSGQQGLFSQEELTKKSKGQLKSFNDISEFNEDELQNLERQLLGFSLSAKPLEEVIGPLTHHSTHKIEEISDEFINDMVRVAAVVSEVRVVVTKRSGAEMAFARIEDGTGALDLVVFPKIFQESRAVWVDNKPVLVTGRIDTREDLPSLIVESVATSETVLINPLPDNRLFIKIPEGTTVEKLKRLKQLFIRHPGKHNITLIFEGKDGGKINLPDKITWDERLADLINALLESHDLS